MPVVAPTLLPSILFLANELDAHVSRPDTDICGTVEPCDLQRAILVRELCIRSIILLSTNADFDGLGLRRAPGDCNVGQWKAVLERARDCRGEGVVAEGELGET